MQGHGRGQGQGWGRVQNGETCSFRGLNASINFRDPFSL